MAVCGGQVPCALYRSQHILGTACQVCRGQGGSSSHLGHISDGGWGSHLETLLYKDLWWDLGTISPG